MPVPSSWLCEWLLDNRACRPQECRGHQSLSKLGLDISVLPWGLKVVEIMAVSGVRLSGGGCATVSVEGCHPYFCWTLGRCVCVSHLNVDIQGHHCTFSKHLHLSTSGCSPNTDECRHDIKLVYMKYIYVVPH